MHLDHALTCCRPTPSLSFPSCAQAPLALCTFIKLREENSLRSRVPSFLWDFPKNPHELATIPLGVSFHTAPRPSLVLSARDAPSQAENPQPIASCRSRVAPALLRSRTDFGQGGTPTHSRPL